MIQLFSSLIWWAPLVSTGKSFKNWVDGVFHLITVVAFEADPTNVQIIEP